MNTSIRITCTLGIVLMALLAFTQATAQPYTPRIITDIRGHVGIGTTTPDPSALLDLSSTTAGMLLPRMTAAQRNALQNPAKGLIVFDLDSMALFYNTGNGFPPVWNQVIDSSSLNGFAWKLLGNSATNPSVNFVGTTDATDFVTRTDNIERMRVQAGGHIGVGTASPDPSALVDLTANNAGFLFTRLTDGERDGMGSPATSLVLYNTTQSEFQYYSGVGLDNGWEAFITTANIGAAGWGLLGNTATNPAVNFLGTTDAVDMVFRTNNLEQMRMTSAGDVGVGTPTPGARFHAHQTGTGSTGHFQNANAGNTATTVNIISNGVGGTGVAVSLTNAANGARGVDVLQAGVGPGVFATSAGGNAVWGITSSISAAGVIGDNTFGEAVVGRNRGGLGVGAVVGRNDSSGYGVRGFNTKNGIGVLGQAGISGGTGVGGRFENVNAANTSSTVEVSTNGIGSGVTVNLSNAANGARGVDVLQTGVGPGVFATSAGGNAVWGITSSISAAGVIGDNTFGEAVVGRNRGGNGVGAVVGRNDSSGYGVRGFNTKNGYGVLGQAGISGGTGVGGRFENVNAANGSDVLQAATNGTGWAGNFTNANNSSATKGVRISTTAGQGGNALDIANGTVALSAQHPYASNTVVDDAILVVTAAGNVTVPTGVPLVDGATVWVVNNAGAVVTVTNTTAGAFNINPGRAVQMLFVSTVSGANWIPVEP